jgi:hypothetical protein
MPANRWAAATGGDRAAIAVFVVVDEPSRIIEIGLRMTDRAGPKISSL